jgi:hypothetical protein
MDVEENGSRKLTNYEKRNFASMYQSSLKTLFISMYLRF